MAYAVYEIGPMREAIERDGFATIRAALPPPLAAAARAGIDRLAPGYWDETGLRDHYKNVFNRDPFWLGFLDRPGIIDLAEALLGADCHIVGQTAWRTHPGHRAEPLHCDYLPFPVPERFIEAGLEVPPFIVTVHYYLCDITADLAPTSVIAGSHRAGRAPREGETEWRGRKPVPILCAAGDALAFRSDLWHRGGDNSTTDRTRYLLQVHYARREMAQHFAPYLEWRFDPVVIAAATPRQRRLLGDHVAGPFD